MTCLKTDTEASEYIFRGASVYTDIFRSCLTIDSSGNETHCPNTSKCISKQRLVDGVPDCYKAIDEFFEDSCQLKDDRYRFQCSSQKKCIPWRNVMDKVWDCIDYEDELTELDTREKPKNFFQIICDGYEHISHPMDSVDHYETDEINCEEWPCNNIYTRDDRALTCFNAEDELDRWLLLHEFGICPINHYPCISPWNFSIFCLPYNQLNDTIIDCFGALDE